jgi:hypothetical protein
MKKTEKQEGFLSHLENIAYSSVLTAYRAQGELSWEKLKILDNLRKSLNISEKKHSVELNRIENDTKLQEMFNDSLKFKREKSDENTIHFSETESESDTTTTPVIKTKKTTIKKTEKKQTPKKATPKRAPPKKRKTVDETSTPSKKVLLFLI